MKTNARSIFLNTIFLFLAMAYVVVGVDEVPFHGDEPTIIWLTKAFDTVALQRDFDAISYEPPLNRTTEQHMGALTGTLNWWVMGAAWHGAGFSPDEISEQWVWGADYEWNLVNGGIPSTRLLKVARLASAWMTALGVIFILGAARILGRNCFESRWAVDAAGWGAGILYILHPALLMNGRRAIFEGSLAMGVAVTAYVALLMIRSRRLADFVLFGIVTGIALSAKHSAVFPVFFLYAGLALVFLLKRKARFGWGGLVLAVVIALALFLLLTPIWWAHTFEMPGIVWDGQRDHLNLQTQLYGGFDSFGERFSALLREVFFQEPQYYEVAEWESYYPAAGDEIAAYESGYLGGLRGKLPVAVLRAPLMLLGIWALVRYFSSENLVFVIWLAGMLVITLTTTPLYWQRYYLPAQLPLFILMGMGIGVIVSKIDKGSTSMLPR